MTHYLIWSMEHHAWWKPGGWGYTTVTHKAGRYPPQEAIKLCAEANRFSVEEIMVVAPSREQIAVDLAELTEADEARDRNSDPEFAPSPAGAAPGKEAPTDAGEAT